ncbi:MAG: dipeptide epimerase [Fimbriimonadaceae bacterium]
MLTLTTQRVSLTKLFPLAISRGVSYGSDNLFVSITDGTHTGLGECAPGAGYDSTLASLAEQQLSAIFPGGELPELGIIEMWSYCRERELAPPAQAAVDMALWDLKAKQLGRPLYDLFGLSNRQAPTSVTIGINPPEVTRERVPLILGKTGAKSLKIKLGSPEGLPHDQDHFMSAKESAAPFGVKLRVDANGGWTVKDSIYMMAWLAQRGVDYVEQPLMEGHEDGLPQLFERRPLPIFVDESCRFSTSIPSFAHCVDGVNLKLMKCGGLTEAHRIVATARAHGLKTMIGCMGESSVAIGAGAAIGALFDHIDLDSHLNLNPDPAVGLGWEDGVVVPSDMPGHGVRLA